MAATHFSHFLGRLRWHQLHGPVRRHAWKRNVRLGRAFSGVGFIDAKCGRTVIGYEVPAPGHRSGSFSLGGSVAGPIS